MAITRTPIIDDDGSGTTGTVLDNAWKQELYNQIDGTLVGGPWTAYTPQWLNTGTANVLGNGTISGLYQLLGNKRMHLQLTLAFGSTSVVGNGAFFFSLPVTAFFDTVIAKQPITCRVLDASAGSYPGFTELYALGTQIVPYALNAPNGLFAAIPFTWSVNDTVEINGVLRLP